MCLNKKWVCYGIITKTFESQSLSVNAAYYSEILSEVNSNFHSRIVLFFKPDRPLLKKSENLIHFGFAKAKENLKKSPIYNYSENVSYVEYNYRFFSSILHFAIFFSISYLHCRVNELNCWTIKLLFLL